MNKSEKEAYFKTLPANERGIALRENATEQYNKNVVRYYTEEELIGMKHELSEAAIKINDIEIEKKEVVAEISGRLKVAQTQQKGLLKGIKNKFYESLETVFDIANTEEGIMETFDINGDLIGTRRLTPSEKQTTIVQLPQSKTGTH